MRVSRCPLTPSHVCEECGNDRHEEAHQQPEAILGRSLWGHASPEDTHGSRASKTVSQLSPGLAHTAPPAWQPRIQGKLLFSRILPPYLPQEEVKFGLSPRQKVKRHVLLSLSLRSTDGQGQGQRDRWYQGGRTRACFPCHFSQHLLWEPFRSWIPRSFLMLLLSGICPSPSPVLRKTSSPVVFIATAESHSFSILLD